MKAYQLFVNGEFVTPSSQASLDVIGPTTREVIARVPDADGADVDRAVGTARAAFDEGPWKTATAQDRGHILFKLAEIVRTRADELAEIETRNSGKPIVEAEYDMADVATCFEYYGGLATKIQGDVLSVPDNAMREGPARRDRVGESHATHLRRGAVGGYKQSGIGRELGRWAVEEYLNVKQMYINLSEEPIGWY